jgi:hypothetical protein
MKPPSSKLGENQPKTLSNYLLINIRNSIDNRIIVFKKKGRIMKIYLEKAVYFVGNVKIVKWDNEYKIHDWVMNEMKCFGFSPISISKASMNIFLDEMKHELDTETYTLLKELQKDDKVAFYRYNYNVKEMWKRHLKINGDRIPTYNKERILDELDLLDEILIL